MTKTGASAWKTFAVMLVVILVGASACAPAVAPTPAAAPTAVAPAKPTAEGPTAVAPAKPTAAAPAVTPTPRVKTGGILRVGNDEHPTRWDLHGSGLGSLFQPLSPVFNVLITEATDDPTGEKLVPDLATGWTVSDGGKTYTFPLQKGVKWHDGKPFTSADVLASMNKIINPPKEIESARKGLFETVAAVEAPDDYTIVFKLKIPDAAFLEVLSIGWNVIYPKHILDQQGLGVMDKVGIDYKIGTGPFKVKDFKLNEYVKLERNPEYFKKGLPYLDGVEFQVIPDRTSQATALIGGKLDAYSTYPGNLQGEDAQVVEQQKPKDITVARVPFLSPFVLYANVTKPPWDNIKVRQAVSESIDRKAATDAFIEGGAVGGLVLPGSRWELPKGELEKMPGYGPDMNARQARAKQLLQEAGFTKDKPLVVNLIVRPSPDSSRVGTVIAPMIEAIDAKVNLVPVPQARQAELRARGEFEITVNNLSQTGIDPTHLFGTYLLCNLPRNQTQLCVPALDKLWEDQRKLTDLAQRKPIVDQLHKGHLEQSHWMVISWRNGLDAWWNYVKGLAILPTVYTSQSRLEHVWLDK